MRSEFGSTPCEEGEPRPCNVYLFVLNLNTDENPSPFQSPKPGPLFV